MSTGAASTRGQDRALRTTVVLACLAIFNAAVWGPTIGSAFVFDDLLNVAGNRWIVDWRALPAAFTHHAAGFDPSFNTSFYRPLMHVFYAVAYALAGPRPWAFHLANVVLHVAAVLCAYQLTRSVLRRWSDGARYRFLPLIAALVFSVHPVHTEAVAWIAGITDLSYSVFGLAALIVYLRAFTRPRFAWVAGAFLLASLLSKETGAAILVLMALFEWIEARNRGSWSSGAAMRRLAPALAAAAAYAGMRFGALGSFAPSAQQHPYAATELVAAAAGLFARYLGLLVAPVNLNVMRSIPLRPDFGDPPVLAGLLAGAALVALAIRFRRSPLALLPAAFATIPVLPALYVPAIESGGSVFGERYLYLPVLGVGWCLGFALEQARHRWPRGRALAAAFVVLVVVSGSAAVVARNRVWADSLSLWTDAVAKSPGNAAAHEGHCFALYGAQRYPEAVEACNAALAIDPKRVDARINRATALLALGRAREARAELDAALAMRPDSAQALVNRGLACMVLGQTAEALASYRHALRVDPEFAEAHNDLGVALARLGRPAEALVHLEYAVRLAPENPEYRANLDACPR